MGESWGYYRRPCPFIQRCLLTLSPWLTSLNGKKPGKASASLKESCGWTGRGEFNYPTWCRPLLSPLRHVWYPLSMCQLRRRKREREKKGKAQWICDYVHVAASVKLLPWLYGAPVWVQVSRASEITPNECEMKRKQPFLEEWLLKIHKRNRGL